MSGGGWVATARGAAHRIDAPIAPTRRARVMALDQAAAAVATRVAGHGWAEARFFVCEGLSPAVGSADALLLRKLDGSPAVLEQELRGAGVVVLLVTGDDGAQAASVIGTACSEAGIMTAGLVLAEGRQAGDATAALRPHARVLLPSADETDVVELLIALRA